MERTMALKYGMDVEVSFLLKRLERHHRETYNHSLRTAYYVLKMTERIHMAEETRNVMIRSALLHDIGKIHIHPDILDNNPVLSDKEWELLSQHPQHAIMLLHQDIESGRLDRSMILHQHENIDGSGLLGLQGTHISLSARMLRVADIYDSITSDPGKRTGIGAEEAFEQLSRWKEIHYDSFVVDQLYQVILRHDETSAMPAPPVVRKLQEEIELLRSQLSHEYDIYGQFTHPAVIRISEMLDRKISEYNTQFDRNTEWLPFQNPTSLHQ